jgi:ornithine cyclodeaminase
MLYVPEDVSQGIVTLAMAISAVREAFIAAGAGSALSFPTVQGIGRDPTHRFSVKAARVDDLNLTGMKVGAYWPSSDIVGVRRGSSAVLFLDDTTGRIEAFVQTTAANAYRTSAADALAVDLLARRDARALALFGAGFQAYHEVMAIREVRPIGRVSVVNRTAERADALVKRFREAGVEASRVGSEEACRNSDVIVTITASRQPLFEDTWVRPGTHLCCMGADDRGKQELPVALLRRARLFADLVSQSTTIGEFQHVAADIAAGTVALDGVGNVANGKNPGRRSDDDITIFDSSGIALQDIFLAKTILEECLRRDRVLHLA